MAMNPELQGREYHQAETYRISAARVASYRNAMALQFGHPGSAEVGTGVPLALPLVMCQGALSAALLDGDLGVDTMRVVYRALDVSFHRAPALDLDLGVSARVQEISKDEEGVRLVVELQLEQANQSLLCASAEFLERHPRPKSRAEEAQLTRERNHANRDSLQIWFESTVHLNLKSVERMLDELGEFNPVYRDVELAQLANLPAPCVPPSYIFALAHQVLEQALAGNTHKLRRLGGRFARPAWIGDTLHLEVGSADGNTGWLHIRDGAGRTVFAHGTFEAASSEINMRN